MKVTRCLADLGIADATPFGECDDIAEEFKAIRKIYLNKARADHPDKGGDPAVFRATQTAWEVLRDLYDNNSVLGGSFTSYFDGTATADDEEDPELDELYKKYASNTNVPSYDYYEAAAEEDVPGYKVELAKSARSTCKKCEEKVPKDDVRVGSLDKVAGTYGRWHHLDCWRVPVKVQNGLTDPSNEEVSLRDLISMEEVLLTGVAALSDANKRLFVQHCVNSEHWARRGKGKKRKEKPLEIMDDAGSSKRGKAQTSMGGAAAGGESGNVVPGSFTVLLPGVDGALGDDFLKDKTFLISGCFPEVGGGEEGSAGVENVKAMIESFGGRVVSRFSKKTNYLLVGQDAVAGKFKDATKREVDIVSLRRLQGLLLGHVMFDGLGSMPALTADMFVGNAYQAAGAPPPPPAKASGGAKKPAAAAKKPAAATKKPAAAAAAKAAAAASASSQALVAVADPPKEGAGTAVVPHTGKKAKFTIPRPGVNGAIAADALAGKRFVLTGTFPELGGGTGLTLGKDRTKAMIESFGGRVTGSVSGKTDFVLIGKDPGRSKVSAGESKGLPLINLISLQKLLMGTSSLEDMASEPPPRITNFSAGYPGVGRIEY